MSANVTSPFAIGGHVFADGSDAFTMSVTGLCIRSTRVMIECTWVSGQVYSAWIEPWRLIKAEPRK